MSSRIALLVTGALPEHLQDIYGDYTAVFTAFMRDALGGHSHEFVLEPFDVVHSMTYPTEAQLKTYDGVMYTGSASNAYDDIEWINKLVEFTARIVHDHPTLKLIGICFGHQIIARALGGSCVRNTSWEIGPTSIDLTPLAQSLFGVNSLNIQQMHRDHVPSLPLSKHTHLLASTPISPIQGFISFFPSTADEQTLANTHILSLQGHPEFIEPIVSSLVAIRTQTGIIPTDVAEDYESRRTWRNDGVSVVGRAVWGVLGVRV